MRHADHFEAFLRDVVNLNTSRIETLEQRVETISRYLTNSDYRPNIMRFNPQGSWAHQTIIKPPESKDFDADLLVVVQPVHGWEPAEYIEKLYRTFRNSDRYREIVTRKTRCLRIDYAGDFHIDLIPIIEEQGHNGIRFLNCNRRDGTFEETAPEAYTDWWNGKNTIVGNDRLQSATRLIKYLRDIKQTFSCKSVLLTTLIGCHVYDDDHLRPELFRDIPTALRTIIGRLDDTLQQHSLMPRVENPVLPQEDYNRHWDQEKYENFRSKVHQYREWIDDAFLEEDEDESVLKWRRIFRDEFAKGQDVSADSRQLAPWFEFANQWIERVKNAGRNVLSSFPASLDHVEPSRWAVRNRLSVTVQAAVLTPGDGVVERAIASGDIVERNKWIRFEASSPTGIPSTFTVWWRVVNTGGHAAQKAGLRGDFYKSSSAKTRLEQTEYRGVHWVEAFVINNRNRECVGKSDRFFVVID